MSNVSGLSKDDLLSPIRAVVKSILGSFLLSMVVLGFLFLVLGVTVIDGVLAGMFGIWGVSLILTCGIAYGIIALNKR